MTKKKLETSNPSINFEPFSIINSEGVNTLGADYSYIEISKFLQFILLRIPLTKPDFQITITIPVSRPVHEPRTTEGVPLAQGARDSPAPATWDDSRGVKSPWQRAYSSASDA